ncbi:MAG: PH domain-containing protein [Clostridia bacterium]|nr:PH domain-containing protein [Clostridia bacterium]
MSKNSKTSFDRDLSMEIKEDEELLWRGVPQKASFILSKSVQLMPIALLWLCFDGFAISMIFSTDVPKGIMIFMLVFFAFHLMPVWFWIHSVFSARRKHKLIEYAFTNQRVIVRDGGIIKSYAYSDLYKVSVKVGFIDRLFKVGDITLSGHNKVVLLDIDSPYAVGNKLQKFIEDFAEQRKKQNALRRRNSEYEEYHENGEYDDYNDAEYYDGDYYDDSKYTYADSYNNDFEEISSAAPIGRFTSKKMPDEADKTEEDEYLDNILDSIDKKDEF